MAFRASPATTPSPTHRPAGAGTAVRVILPFLVAIPLWGCPGEAGTETAGPDAASIEWALTCGPTGQNGPVIIEYENDPETPEIGFYHAGFRATGSGPVTVTVTTEVHGAEGSTTLDVVDGASYHLTIGFSGYTYDASDPANIGTDDEFVLSSPAAADSEAQGVSYLQVTTIYDLDHETCP